MTFSFHVFYSTAEGLLQAFLHPIQVEGVAIFGDENRLKPEPVYIGLWSNIGERGYRALTNESPKLENPQSRLVAPSLSRAGSKGREAGQGCVALQEDTEGTIELFSSSSAISVASCSTSPSHLDLISVDLVFRPKLSGASDRWAFPRI